MQFELVASAATDGLTGGVALPADIVYRCRALDRRLMNRWSLSAPFADELKLLGITMLDEAVAQTPRLAVQAVGPTTLGTGGRGAKQHSETVMV